MGYVDFSNLAAKQSFPSG